MVKSPSLDRGRHAAPQLYEQLRVKLIALEFPPGTVLSRSALAADFHVSQTPVREALLRLAEERLVDVFPQSATRASLIDIGFAQASHFLRRAIELELVRDLAQRPAAPEVARMRGLLETQRQLYRTMDLDAFVEADQAFHRCLYEAGDKLELWGLVRSRSGHIDRLRRLHLPADGKLQRILADHERIVASLERGEPEAAQAALREHLSGTLAQVAEIQRIHPAYFA